VSARTGREQQRHVITKPSTHIVNSIMNKTNLRMLGLLAVAALGASSQAAVVFTDNFDLADYPGGGTPAELMAKGWTTVEADPGNIGVSISGNGGGTTESVLWGNNAYLEFNYAGAPVNCGDLISIDVNCTRFEGYSYLREIILWDGSNPATRETVATLNAVGHALGPWATWWTPPAKDQIESLTYAVAPENAGKYVIFRYGHSSGWGETADVSFSVTTITTPVFTVQPVPSMERAVGESATLTAAALGCSVTYQWNKDGVALGGQTGTTLQLTGLTTADSGNYTVTATTSAGSTTSTGCALVVNPRLGGGASISLGVSFSHSYSGYPFNPDVTATAYGVHPTRWHVAPMTPVGAEGIDAGNGQYSVSWSAANTWWVGGDNPQDLVPGNEQVNFAYLDDGGSGYSVDISGLISAVGFNEYVIRTVAASDNATNFNTVTLTDNSTSTSQDLTYGALVPATSNSTGRAALSSISTVLTSDYITLTSMRLPDTQTRGCLAGFMITDKPVLLTQPIGPVGVVFNGEPINLSAEAYGVPTLVYQWRKDGVPISGATSPSFSIASSVVGDTGVYDLLITNTYGAAVSLPVPITVVAAIQPTVTRQPVAHAVYDGGVARFYVEGYGGQLSYQWNKNGTPISGATGTVLTLTGVSAADEADYSVTISNPAGLVTSDNAHLTVLPVPVDGYLGAVLADAPISLWRLEEGGGPMAYDSLGGRDGTYVGSVGYSQPGFTAGDVSVNFPNSGWVLDNPSTYVEVPYTAALNPAGAFSIEFWSKISSIPADLFSPLAALDLNAGRSGFLFYLNGGSGWQFRLGNAGGAYVANVAGGTTTTDWQHIVGVYDGAGNASLFVNGVQFGPVALSGNFDPNQTQPLRIGAPTGLARPWNGLVDEVAFYNYALSPAQVSQHTLSGTPLRISMTAASDIVVNAAPAGAPVNGQNFGATWLASDAGRSGVMQFDATNGNQIVVRGYPQLNSTVGTISFWVRVNEFPATGSESAIVLDRRNTGGSGSGTVIGINDGLYAPAGTIFFQANPSGANPFSSGTTVNDGNWHHVAVTYSQAQYEVVTIYIDGNLDAAQANNLAWWWPGDLTVLLGKSRDGYWKKLHGSLDDVRFYDRILNDQEVAQLATGAVVDANALVLRLNFDAAPASGYRLVTSPVDTTIQGSATANGSYSDVGNSPYLHIPGATQFFRARLTTP